MTDEKPLTEEQTLVLLQKYIHTAAKWGMKQCGGDSAKFAYFMMGITNGLIIAGAMRPGSPAPEYTDKISDDLMGFVRDMEKLQREAGVVDGKE